jgi:hypothetical protein
MDVKTRDLIDKLTRLSTHPGNTPEEREGAVRALARIQARIAADTETADGKNSGGYLYYRLPDIVCGAKRAESGYIPTTEITALIRKDIKFLRGTGRGKGKAADIAVPNAIATAPREMRITVSHKYLGNGVSSITVKIRNVPADWWQIGYSYYDDAKQWPRPEPTGKLLALRGALLELMWAYNYDGTDAQIDHFNRGFYEHVEADGHGDGGYKDIMGSWR